MSSSSTNKSRRGCWTCKRRKVQCDQGVPNCRRCVQAKRHCEGYGLRLSWPRENDKKRAIVSVLPVDHTQIRQQHLNSEHFINTISQDIEFYSHLSCPVTLKALDPGLPRVKLWSQPQSDVTQMELIHYFRDAAHESLGTFSPTMSHIRDVIIPMVFTSDTVSRCALLHALLAFSSLHRSGLHHKTMSLKVAALGALSASAKEVSQGLVEAAQHVAACMLLCSFEILLPSDNSGEWLWYIRGAMEVIEGAQLGHKQDCRVVTKLLDWVHYHDSMSRFTLFHWKQQYPTVQPTETKSRPVPQSTNCSLFTENSKNPTHAVLNILSEICDVLLDPSDPRCNTVEYIDRLRALEWRVDNLPPATYPTLDSDDARDDFEFTVQLYQVATRVYLARASQNPLKPTADLDYLVDRQFAGPVKHCYCRHFFPLLIIACEARTDEQRIAILNLIDRTDQKGYGRSMETFRAQVQSFWIQQDLYADSDLNMNYLGLMKSVISSDRTLPSYV
ncbi:fungal-specific transcription factor domain-containing protein [Xylaria flabelliformis]|nr:fungal-specific transcription factor domain-containing protein [Xylaria flabelliformis]